MTVITLNKKNKKESFQFSEKDIEKLFFDIHTGRISPRKLPKELYSAIALHLFDDVLEGVVSVDFGFPDLELVAKLRENIYLFSAAKTFHQTLEMSDAIVDDNNVLRPFAEFRAAANEIFVKYNGGTIDNVVKPGWLEAEYNTAIAQAYNGKKWDSIEKHKSLFPYLRYNATNGACPICAPLNGIVARVGDAFWSKYMPLNHFNCNCTVDQLEIDEGNELFTSKQDIETAKSKAKVPVDFLFNPGRTKEAFSTRGESKHPYFTVPRKYETFAKNNFNLKIPKN